MPRMAKRDAYDDEDDDAYAQQRARSDEDDEHDDESSNSSDDDEEDDEEDADWTELMPRDELDALPDGPSTYFVGDWSACRSVADAVAHTRYCDDCVLVYPGVYDDKHNNDTNASATIVLDESRLRGLHIVAALPAPPASATAAYATTASMSVLPSPRHRGTAAADDDNNNNNDNSSTTPDDDGGSSASRRIGPWFTYAAAAMVDAVAATRGGGGAVQYDRTATIGTRNNNNGVVDGKPHTTMASTVYGSVLTATTCDGRVCPVLVARVVVTCSDARDDEDDDNDAKTTHRALQDYTPPSRRRRRHHDGDDDNDNDDDEDESDDSDDDGEDDNNDEEEEEHSDNDDDGKDAHASTRSRRGGVVLGGLCLAHGIELHACTRTQLQHCVLGLAAVDLSLSTSNNNGNSNNTRALASTPYTATVTAHALCAATLQRCIVYGGRAAYAVYAYPRCALTLRSSLVEGAALSASQLQLRRHVTRRDARHAASPLALLELRAQQRAAAAAAAHRGSSGGGGSATASTLTTTTAANALAALQSRELAHFVVPTAASVVCDVAVYVDDGDVQLRECMISNTRIGLLLRDACTGARVVACDVRSVSEVGVYMCGTGGSALLRQCRVQACGRECLLVAGPADYDDNSNTAVTIAVAAAAAHADANDDDDDADSRSNDDADGARASTLRAQHPRVQLCTLVGAVRLQGDVRDGAMLHNVVYAPLQTAATTATTATAAAATATAVRPAAMAGRDKRGSAAAAALVTGSCAGVTYTTPVHGFHVVQGSSSDISSSSSNKRRASYGRV